MLTNYTNAPQLDWDYRCAMRGFASSATDCTSNNDHSGQFVAPSPEHLPEPNAQPLRLRATDEVLSAKAARAMR